MNTAADSVPSDPCEQQARMKDARPVAGATGQLLLLLLLHISLLLLLLLLLLSLLGRRGSLGRRLLVGEGLVLPGAPKDSGSVARAPAGPT